MARLVISGANTSLQDWIVDVGIEFIGDDLAGIGVISLVTSSTAGGSSVDIGVPTKDGSISVGYFRFADWLIQLFRETVIEIIDFLCEVDGESFVHFSNQRIMV